MLWMRILIPLLCLATLRGYFGFDRVFSKLLILLRLFTYETNWQYSPHLFCPCARACDPRFTVNRNMLTLLSSWYSESPLFAWWVVGTGAVTRWTMLPSFLFLPSHVLASQDTSAGLSFIILNLWRKILASSTFWVLTTWRGHQLGAPRLHSYLRISSSKNLLSLQIKFSSSNSESYILQLGQEGIRSDGMEGGGTWRASSPGLSCHLYFFARNPSNSR